jgi:hypothetical protein
VAATTRPGPASFQTLVDGTVAAVEATDGTDMAGQPTMCGEPCRISSAW